MKVDFNNAFAVCFCFNVQHVELSTAEQGVFSVAVLHCSCKWVALKFYALYLAVTCSEGMWEARRHYVTAKWVAFPASNLGPGTDFLVQVVVVVVVVVRGGL